MPRRYDDDLFESTKMTFGEHLDELRAALVKSVLALVLGFLVALLFAGDVVDYVQKPLKAALTTYYQELAEQAKLLADDDLVAEERFIDAREALDAIAEKFPGAVRTDALPPRDANKPVRREDLVPLRIYHSLDDDPRIRVIGLAMEEPFSMYVKTAMVVGAVLASPFVFYFLWQFVAAGLYPHEKRYVHVFLPVSLTLFLAGVFLAFFVVFKFVLAFLIQFYAWMGLDPDPRISNWLTFVLVLPLGFGISFQLPLVMLFLERIGIFTVATYVSHWRIAVLVIFVLAMIFTPTDPWSMILLATPLTGLYFLGVLMCRLMERRTKK